MYDRCGMRERGSGVECGVVEWVKRSTLRWFATSKGWEMRNLLRCSYLSSVEGPSRRSRPLGRWEDRVKEYVGERGVEMGKTGVHG